MILAPELSELSHEIAGQIVGSQLISSIPHEMNDCSLHGLTANDLEGAAHLTVSAPIRACFRTGWGPFWRVCARGPMTLHLRESTIHEQFDSRDVAAIVGCEKHDGFSSLIGRSEPSERNGLGDHSFAFLAYL